MKQAMGRTMKFGAKGIKTAVSGRLGGADIVCTESYHDVCIPRTLRGRHRLRLRRNNIWQTGVKVWIYKGEVLPVKAAKKEGGAK